MTHHELVTAMLGRELELLEEIAHTPTGAHRDDTVPPIVRAVDTGREPRVQPVSLDIRRGEVVGLAGLLGSGRTEFARLLFGADRATSGHIDVDGKTARLRTPRAAIARRFAFTSENRKGEGIVGELSVRDNLVLALQARRGFARPLSNKAKTELVQRYMEALDIRPRDPDVLIKNLSGGNQQKVLLARWLITQPKLCILDEPTRGIDVGAKYEIYTLINELAARGKAVIVISSELPELLGLCDRIYTLSQGRLTGEVAQADATQETLMRYMMKGRA
jgi:simple sugar transport system ATP-binding protein